MIAVLIGYESALRILSPVAIRFEEATALAVVGLAVNVASAWVLSGDGHSHHGRHDHGDHRGHDRNEDGHGHAHRHDTNMRAALVHVVADALTSVLAIAALLGGRLYGWVWLDPVMGVVGALVILSWSASLVRAAGATLLDVVPSATTAQEIRRRLETQGDKVSDLHLWRVGPGHLALIASVVTDGGTGPDVYKARLAGVAGLSHATVEVHACPGADGASRAA